jgi:dTDP-4-amino-4,6-dideoxygalactose transaminase
MSPPKVPILRIPFDPEDASAISAALSEMLLAGRLAMGPNVERFEALFRDFVGSRRAVGCASGTAALEMIFRALDYPGGSVAVPANTFMATALAPAACGLKILLVDCDPDHFQMDPDDLSRRLLPDTRAVVATHVGGMISGRFGRIAAICEANGLDLIEDAAHAHGAEAGGRRAGTLGLAAAFSFFPTKVLTTAEGGMVATSDEALAEALLAVRQHGQARPGSNVHESFGLNFRPSEIHALLGLRMMAKAEWILSERRRAAAAYDRLLDGSLVRPVLAPEGQKPAYYKYMALLPEGADRGLVKKTALSDYSVALAGEVYSTPVHRQPLWAAKPHLLAAPAGDCPNADMVARRQICLPIWPGMEEADQELVVEALNGALGRL